MQKLLKNHQKSYGSSNVQINVHQPLIFRDVVRNEDPSSSKDLGRTLALFVEDKGDSDETTTTKTDMLDMCPF